MSKSPQLFQPPKSYPEAPKDMWYQVPPEPPAPTAVSRLFPWEGQAPAPSRVFFDETRDTPESSTPGLLGSSEVTRKLSFDMRTSTGTVPTSSWGSYSRANAWDEVPEIERYMHSVQKPRQSKVQVLSGSSSGKRKPSLRLTDFPTAIERPSLPVTPAPIRKSNYFNDNNDAEALQGAKGVPKPEEWVRLTVDVFANVLRATYLYWSLIEPVGTTREAASTPLRSS